MPRQDLITRKTDLKSLKYGSSGPYIQKDINNPPVYNSISSEITHRIDDTVRIGKMLVDTPGLKFALNQAFLNYSSSEKKGFGKRLLGALGDTAKVLASTIAQVPVNGTGTHFVIGFGGHEYLKQGGQRGGWLDRVLQTTAGTGGVNGASTVLAGKNVIFDHRGEEGYKPMTDSELIDQEYKDQLKVDIATSYIKQEGRTLAKAGSIIIPENAGQEGYTPINPGIDRTDAYTDVDINQTYTGQDGRVLLKGIAGTSITASVPTRIDDDSQAVVDKFKTSLENVQVDAKTQYDITAAVSRDQKDPFHQSGKGLGPKVDPNAATTKPHKDAPIQENTLTPYLGQGGQPAETGKPQTGTSPSKQKSDLGAPKTVVNKSKTVTGKPAIRDYKEADTGVNAKTSYNTQAVDKKGMLDRYDKITHEYGANKYTSKIKKNDDMIPFVFSIVTPETAEKPTQLAFRAYLDSMNDNYSSTWNSFNYIGRGEKFYTYGGFERKSSVSFKVAAMNSGELDVLYKKVNHLASATAPTYDAAGTWMRGTFLRMTIGTYFDDQPCLLNSVGITVDQNVPWEIDIDGTVGMEVPHVLSVALDLTLLHDTTPKTGFEKYFGFRKAGSTSSKASGDQDPSEKEKKADKGNKGGGKKAKVDPIKIDPVKIEPLPRTKLDLSKFQPIPIAKDNTRDVRMEQLVARADKLKADRRAATAAAGKAVIKKP